MPLSIPFARVMLALLVAASFQGCATRGSGEPQGRGGRGITPVAIERVTSGDLARRVSVAAPVEPIRSVSVSALAAGTVLQVLVEEGSQVRAGQRLAELDAREQNAQLARARAVLANAEAAFQRAERLRAGEITSAADLDAARAAFDIAKADADLWRTRVEFTRITSPVAGVVTAKHTERGASVSANQPLFDIADASQLVVRVRVSELDVVHLRPGVAVAVSLDAYPGSSIASRVRRIYPSADAASRLVPVEIALGPTPSGVVARPGYLARADFSLEKRTRVLTVPNSAVGVADSRSYVFVVDADTLIRRPVEIGMTAEGRVEIVSGLRVGEAVVRSGHSNLRPGLTVRVMSDSARAGPAS